MAWLSTNLAAASGQIVVQAQAAIAQVESGLAALGSQISAIDGKVADAQASAGDMKGKLSALEESGFHMITLGPKTGAWDDRLDQAANEPIYEPHLYCAGTASIILLPSMAEAVSAYAKMKTLLSSPVADVSSLIPDTDLDFSPPDIPGDFAQIPPVPDPQDIDELFESDVWKGTALGDVYGGKKTGIGRAAKAKAEEGAGIFAAANNLKRRSSGLTKNIAIVSNLIAEATATGTYNIILEPGRGRYLTRLKAESGAPPNDPSFVTCGFVCIAVAGTLAEVTEKFAKMTEVLNA